MIEYLLESTLCLSVLYFSHVVLFRNSRNYRMNRITLLSSVIFSLLIPVFKISLTDLPIHETVQKSNFYEAFSSSNYLSASEISNNVALKTSVDISVVLVAIYALVTLILLARFVFNISRLIMKGYKSDKMDYKGNELTLVEEQINAFSFFKAIFISRDHYRNGTIDEMLLWHEMAHKQQLHSVDVIIIELTQVFFWFNPFVYLFKKLIKANHEYLADEFVLKSGACPVEYSNKLLDHTFQNRTLGFTSGFNHLLIKKRLTMLSKFEQKKRFVHHLALFIPVMVVLFFMTAFTSSNSVFQDRSTNIIPTEKPGIFYAETLFWSSEDHEVYMRGKVKVRYGVNQFTGDGSFAILGKVHLLIFNGKQVAMDSSIALNGIKCEVVTLTKEEAIEKYGSRGKLGAVEIRTVK
ncbi:M56 family metallopeptidase [Fulvivirgaceae bacterium BMA12]|uniref:M56 family metallopeptidase n=1 Tax=Agaribacillus aureus TaxID=3051825 RepID=A0ABT8LCL0_9BACT|nr:M56 family metallopeptidase [Fulvivirgaceae bacterium BMA12]